MMSPMWPVRAWPSAESSAPGPPRTIPSERSRSPPAFPVGLPSAPGAVVVGARPSRVDEVLVLQPEHGPAPDGQVPPPCQPLRVQPRRPVERLGHRGAPVDHQRLVVGARDRQAADVERLAQCRAGVLAVLVGLGQPVDAPEVEGLIPDVELLQPGQAGADHDVPLGPRLEGAAPAEVQDTLEHLARLTPHELQTLVGTVEELLLILQIGMFGHLSPFYPWPTGKQFSLDASCRLGGRGGDAYDEPDRKDGHADLDHERRARLQGDLGAR